MEFFLIYPVNLFLNINKLINKKVFLIEEPKYFTEYKYHKLKIAYHRATMKSYYDYLLNNNIKVEYIDFYNVNQIFYESLNDKTKNIKMYDPCDKNLVNKILKYIPNLIIEETLNFTVNKNLIDENINKFYNGKKYNHQNFYKWQRKRLNILIEKDGEPTGGIWSYDKDNRKKLPKDIKIPNILNLDNDKYINQYINESKIYIEKYFKNNYGSLDNFIYPINHEDSKKWLIYFLKNKFTNFGIYEDAESDKDPFLFHSVLTPMMNIGLLTDNEVLNIVLKYQDKTPIESFEGFIRQIIGWRNYMYTIYLLESENMVNSNFLNNKNVLNKKMMWEGNTDILPIDNIINKIVNYGYAHHIERLMYLGNYMLLCMIDPKDVYEIFMEWTIDAYEWVMIPNVYAMSQYADGGSIMTRPYFSSSNYILKMSDYKKKEWCKIWDALYYNFINTHEKILEKNYATARQVILWRKKSDLEKKNLLKISKKYLDKINNM
jgi:deoxyribodipyrimidine photolyase-related protein